MFGQVGFFNKFAGKAYEDKRPLERYVNESKRLLGVLDGRLDGRRWLMGDDYTIADIATLGWVNNLITFYEARELVAFDSFAHVDLPKLLRCDAIARCQPRLGILSPRCTAGRASPRSSQPATLAKRSKSISSRAS
jgi:glutathione S-transferase